MKKLLLVVPLLLTGCGLKVVKKQDAQDAVNKAYVAIDEAKSKACGADVEEQIDRAKVLIDAFIEAYLK